MARILTNHTVNCTRKRFKAIGGRIIPKGLRVKSALGLRRFNVSMGRGAVNDLRNFRELYLHQLNLI